MCDSTAIGKLLEALDQAGGFSELLPAIPGLSARDAFEAADHAEQRGYLTTPAGRNAANHLSTVYNIKLTPTGMEFLKRHRGTVSHQLEGAIPASTVDSSRESRIERRTRFLRAMYEEAQASELVFINGPKVGDELGLLREETDDVMRYWDGEGLIRYVTEEGLIALTHKGIVEIEQALTSPGTATPHFAANTIIIHGDVSGSQIQAGANHSHQTLDALASDSMVLDFVRAMRAAIAEEPMDDPADNVQAEEMIRLIEGELDQPKPNRRLVSAVTRTLRDLSIGMAASGGWASVVALAHQLPH
jgi:hypothetical protein